METSPWVRYLLAKQSVDDRALNRRVWQALEGQLAGFPPSQPLEVLELGAGIGTMLARMLRWGLLARARYTLLDAHPALEGFGRHWLRTWWERQGGQTVDRGETLVLHGPGVQVETRWVVARAEAFVDQAPPAAFDLVVAHAFLDLVDVEDFLPRLWPLLRPGGLAYFTLIFDGLTLFLPEAPDLAEDALLARYHESMNTRGHGSARSGRQALAWATAFPQARVLAAGASDWLVFPQNGAYPGDEAFFLEFIVETVYRALRQDPAVDPKLAEAWYRRRRADVESGRLLYAAHQWDLLLQKPLTMP